MPKKLTPKKAQEILHDKEVYGKPLTEKQRKFFGAVASGAVPKAQKGLPTLTPITADNVSQFFELFSVPQKAATKLVTGKYQAPSEAMGIENPIAAFATNLILDPLTYFGGAAVGAEKQLIPAAKAVGKKIDRAIYPTRAYRAEVVGGNKSLYDPNPLAEKIGKKGEWATKDLGEAFQYTKGYEGFEQKPGLLTGDDVLLTEYKLPFWKRNVTSDPDVVRLKEAQGMDINPNEYIIPRNSFLYPRRTNTLKAAPEQVKQATTRLPSGKEVQLYGPGSLPLSYSSHEFASPVYRYIEDQLNAVTGHRAPFTFDIGSKEVPMFNWTQPKTPPAEGVGKFKRKEGGGIPKAQPGLRGEVTYSHVPKPTYHGTDDPAGDYMLRRTVTPYKTRRQIKKNTGVPSSPSEVNFISNYAGAIGSPLSEGFEWPTSVPYEGAKHWNIDRFIIDPQFGDSYPSLRNEESTKRQMKMNTLSDMYKYFMLQNPEDKKGAWKQAKKFMRTEVNPRVKGAVYDDYIRGNLGSIVPNITGLTNVVTPDYLAKYQNVKESVSSPYQDRFTERFKEDPMSPRQVKRVGMDWLMNYKGMSRKEAREYLKSTENKQMGGKVRKAQSYLNVRPSSMMPLNQSVTQPVYSSIPNPSLSGRTAINIFQDKQNETEKELGKATKTAEDFMLNWSLSPMHNQMAKESHKNWKENFGSDHESKLNYLNRLRNLKNAITNDFLWHASSNLGERTQGEHESDSRIPERSLIRIKKGLNDAEKESVAIHELSHATDVRDGILPWDVYKMKDFSSDYASQFPEKKSYTAEEESSRNYRNYVADPTETRARLNNIRFDAKKAGIYDPFTEKLDEDKFQKLMKFYLNNPDRENTPLYELMDAYDLDQIFNMLNSISKNDPKKGDVSQAKGGMEIIADDGKDIVMPFDGPYASAPDGYEGLGYSSEGYNYNPAWGGRWQAGGVVENSEGIRYEHEPGSSGGLSNWNPVRTDAPDTTRRGIKKYTQAPASGKDVDFITNYANFRKAWRGEPEDYNPSTVPYEGDKHWNVKRFLLDTHLDDYYPDLNSFNSSLKERKKDVLTDMYKYYLLQNPEDRKGAWRQANKFMRQEVNPLVRGSFYKKYLSRPEDGKYSLYNSNAIAPSVDWANSNRLSYLHQERNSPMESDLEAMKQGKRFYTDRQMKRMSMDYFKNYRKMSRKDARQLWNQWEEQVKAEDEEWFREYQGGGMLPGMGGTMYARTGQDWKPKNISQDGSEIEGEEVIEDDMGQWAHPGEVTKINSNEITMEGVPYPVLGVSDTGDAKVMMPGEENIEFEGTSVTEYPLDGEEQNQPKPKTELEKVLESTSKYDKGATFKSLVGEVAKSSNISASWLFGSAFTEGMNIAALNPKMVSEGYLKAIENGVSFKGYPVDGFYNYGLDRFAENFKEFVKKGYLPSDFDFKPYKAMNELGEVVNTAAFKNNKDALKAKAAFLKHERDNIRKVAKNLGVKLSPEEEQFFAMASYNSPLGAQNMLKEIAKEKINPTSYILDKTRKRGQVYKNIMPRYRMMMALAGQFAFGGTIQDRGQLKKLDQLTNFTNYNRYD